MHSYRAHTGQITAFADNRASISLS